MPFALAGDKDVIGHLHPRVIVQRAQGNDTLEPPVLPPVLPPIDPPKHQDGSTSTASRLRFITCTVTTTVPTIRPTLLTTGSGQSRQTPAAHPPCNPGRCTVARQTTLPNNALHRAFTPQNLSNLTHGQPPVRHRRTLLQILEGSYGRWVVPRLCAPGLRPPAPFRCLPQK